MWRAIADTARPRFSATPEPCCLRVVSSISGLAQELGVSPNGGRQTLVERLPVWQATSPPTHDCTIMSTSGVRTSAEFQVRNRSLEGALFITSLTAALSGSVMATTTHSPLPNAVTGERRQISGRLGVLSYYVAGPAESGAPPLLLIQSINAAGSAYEVRPLHEHYRTFRTVYSMDLPGYGFSDRSDRDYTLRLMTDAILAMTEEIERRQGPGPIDALALSLSSEFLARDLHTTRDPGAHHVVYRFVSGFLFSGDITRVYESLTMPVWMGHGVR
jgi:hypothetical protein